MPQYWGGTKHFFLLTLYNFKNIWGGGSCPPPPLLLRGPCVPLPKSTSAIGTFSTSINYNLCETHMEQVLILFSLSVEIWCTAGNTLFYSWRGLLAHACECRTRSCQISVYNDVHLLCKGHIQYLNTVFLICSKLVC